MAATTTTTVASVIPPVLIDELILSYLRNAVVVTPLVRYKDIAGIPGLKASFNSFGASAMVAKTQGTPVTPTALTTVEDGTVTAAEVALAFEISDLSQEAAPGVTDDALARELANAAATKIETDICAGFSTFTAKKGTTGTVMSIATFEDALLALRQAKAPTVVQPDSNLPSALAGYFCVLSEAGAMQLGAALGARGTLNPSTVALLETLGSTAAAAARFNYLGVNVFAQDLVPTINAGADRSGAILCPAAIGYVSKRMPRIETQRAARNTATDHVGSAVYGAAVIKQAFGVEIVHKA